MESRRGFITSLLLGMIMLITSLILTTCGAKPDAETEPSPEWPPKD